MKNNENVFNIESYTAAIKHNAYSATSEGEEFIEEGIRYKILDHEGRVIADGIESKSDAQAYIDVWTDPTPLNQKEQHLIEAFQKEQDEQFANYKKQLGYWKKLQEKRNQKLAQGETLPLDLMDLSRHAKFIFKSKWD